MDLFNYCFHTPSCYFIIMYAINLLTLYSSHSIFDIVIIHGNSKYLFVELLVYYAHMLGGRKYVSVVLRYNLPADSPYMPGLFRVVDRSGDSTIESFAIHPPCIRLVDNGSWDYLVSFLIFLSNLRGAHFYLWS